MKIFIAGGTGVIGWRTVQNLVAGGHEVTAVVRSDDKAALIESLGARPVRVSLFDRQELMTAVAGSEVVINLATSLPSLSRVMSLSGWKANDRVRTEGSRNLVDAALAAGAGRYIQESISFVYADGGEEWLDEKSRIETSPITASALDAEAGAERFTRSGGVGVALRFGAFYGPDSEHSILQIKTAKMGLDPLPGKADYYLSSISTDDAAAAVVAALEAPAGVYNIVDDVPVTRDRYDRALASAVGVRKVRRPWMPGKTVAHVARSHRVSNRRFREATVWAPGSPCVTEAFPDLVAQTGVVPVPEGARRIRRILGVLAIAALALGVWAQFAPGSFYDSFPGWGRGWVSLDGAFNEHLIRDVGGLNLALAVVTIVALASLSPSSVHTAGAAWLAYGLPHLIYHAGHLAPYSPVDRVLNLTGLVAVLAGATVLVRWKAPRATGRLLKRDAPRVAGLPERDAPRVAGLLGTSDLSERA